MIAAERAVLAELVHRELDARVRGSLLGFAWLLLLPLLQLAVLAWVFGHLLPARAASGALPYAAFVALALWPWNLFAGSVSRGVTALTDHAALIGKVAVPLRLYVDARVIACVLIESLGLLLVLAALWGMGVPLVATALPAAALAWLVVVAWAWALASVLAVLQVFLRDIAASIGQLLTLGFFLSPVLYSGRDLPPRYAQVLALNPLAAPLDGLRSALAGDGHALLPLLLSLALAVLLWWAARVLLQRARGQLEDFL